VIESGAESFNPAQSVLRRRVQFRAAATIFDLSRGCFPCGDLRGSAAKPEDVERNSSELARRGSLWRDLPGSRARVDHLAQIVLCSLEALGFFAECFSALRGRLIWREMGFSVVVRFALSRFFRMRGDVDGSVAFFFDPLRCRVLCRDFVRAHRNVQGSSAKSAHLS